MKDYRDAVEGLNPITDHGECEGTVELHEIILHAGDERSSQLVAYLPPSHPRLAPDCKLVAQPVSLKEILQHKVVTPYKRVADGGPGIAREPPTLERGGRDGEDEGGGGGGCFGGRLKAGAQMVDVIAVVGLAVGNG